VKRLVILCLFLSACGASQWHSSATYRAIYEAARHTCDVVAGLPPPGPAEPYPDGGTP